MHGVITRLGRTSAAPALYLVSYVLLIPLFGLTYYQLPAGSFYAPYAQWEPTSIHDRDATMGLIAQSIRSKILAHRVSNVSPDVLVTELQTPPRQETVFDVYFVDLDTKSGRSIAALTATFALSRMGYVAHGQKVCHYVNGPLPEFSVVSPGGRNPGVTNPVNDIFFSEPLLTGANGVCWSQSDEDHYQRLIEGSNGNPAAWSGYAARMMYFSATTLTTVGFGDIVPLSEPARTLAAIEAVAGWIIAGLFLNALANRVRERKSRKPLQERPVQDPQVPDAFPRGPKPLELPTA